MMKTTRMANDMFRKVCTDLPRALAVLLLATLWSNSAVAQDAGARIAGANCAELRVIMADSGLTQANPRIAPRWQALGCDRPQSPPRSPPPPPTPTRPSRPATTQPGRPVTVPTPRPADARDRTRPSDQPASPDRPNSSDDARQLRIRGQLRAARSCSDIDVIALQANWTRNQTDVAAERRRLNCDLAPVATLPATPPVRSTVPSRSVTRPRPAPSTVRTPPPTPPVVVVSPTVPVLTPIRPNYDIIASRGLMAWNDRRLAEGRGLLEQACTNGSAIGCNHLGTTLITPNPINDPAYPMNPARAHVLFYQACATLVNACENGLHLRAARAHGPTDANGRPEWVPDAAVTRYLFERSGRADERLECNDKPGLCFWLGMAYRRGIGGTADPVRGMRMVQRACAGGRGLIEACEEYAEGLVSGVGITQNISEALRISEPLCLGNSATGCLIILRHGNPLTHNNGYLALDVPCRSGNLIACIQQADRAFDGRGALLDKPWAVQRMEAICARTPPAGNRRPTAYACEWIAVRDEQSSLSGILGRSINRDQYRFLACRYGSERSCVTLSQNRLIEAIQGR